MFPTGFNVFISSFNKTENQDEDALLEIFYEPGNTSPSVVFSSKALVGMSTCQELFAKNMEN